MAERNKEYMFLTDRMLITLPANINMQLQTARVEGAAMPRIKAKKKEYRVCDMSRWIRDRLYQEGITQTRMAEKMGLSQPAFCLKMKNGSYTLWDILTLFEVLEASDEEILRLMRMR